MVRKRNTVLNLMGTKLTRTLLTLLLKRTSKKSKTKKTLKRQVWCQMFGCSPRLLFTFHFQVILNTQSCHSAEQGKEDVLSMASSLRSDHLGLETGFSTCRLAESSERPNRVVSQVSSNSLLTTLVSYSCQGFRSFFSADSWGLRKFTRKEIAHRQRNSCVRNRLLEDPECNKERVLCTSEGGHRFQQVSESDNIQTPTKVAGNTFSRQNQSDVQRRHAFTFQSASVWHVIWSGPSSMHITCRSCSLTCWTCWNWASEWALSLHCHCPHAEEMNSLRFWNSRILFVATLVGGWFTRWRVASASGDPISALETSSSSFAPDSLHSATFSTTTQSCWSPWSDAWSRLHCSGLFSKDMSGNLQRKCKRECSDYILLLRRREFWRRLRQKLLAPNYCTKIGNRREGVMFSRGLRKLRWVFFSQVATLVSGSKQKSLRIRDPPCLVPNLHSRGSHRQTEPVVGHQEPHCGQQTVHRSEK